MAIFYLRRIDTPILFNEKGSRVAACMVIYMTLKLAMTAAITLWKTGLPEKAIKYIYDKANVILLDERSDRESFQTALEHYSDDELMIYVPDVYQEDIYRIDYARLKENGIKLISFDIDDTIDDTQGRTSSTSAKVIQRKPSICFSTATGSIRPLRWTS